MSGEFLVCSVCGLASGDLPNAVDDERRLVSPETMARVVAAAAVFLLLFALHSVSVRVC